MAGILEQLKTLNDVNEIMDIDDREFRAIIGLSRQAFLKLLPTFEQSHRDLTERAEAARTRPRQRQPGGGRKATLRSMVSKLGFILHYCKRYDTFDDIGDRVGFHRSNASRNVQGLLEVLLATLEQLQVLPHREFTTPEALQAAWAGIEELVIDATERPLLRPQDASAQTAAYSGKKNSIR